MIKNWIIPFSILGVAFALELVALTSAYEPLQRAGSLLVIWGVFIEVKYVLRITGDTVYTGAEKLAIMESPKPSSFQDHHRTWANHAGVIWIIVGTALAGFGNLIS